jgi:hypothetical protein
VIKSRRMRWVGYVSCTADSGGAYRVLVGRREGKKPLGALRHTWEDRFKWTVRKWDGGHYFIYALFVLS